MWKNGKHPPMPPRERAKQFIPFAAVRGLEEALRERERQTEQRVELQADAAEELDRALRAVRAGDMVRVQVYADGRYTLWRDVVESIDPLTRVLTIADGHRICFDDLRSVEILQ